MWVASHRSISMHEEKPNGGGRANSAEDARTQDSTRLISMAMEVTGQSNYMNRWYEGKSF